MGVAGDLLETLELVYICVEGVLKKTVELVCVEGENRGTSVC